MQRAGGEVDICPSEPEQLPFAHPGGEGEDVEGFQPVSLDRLQEASCLIRGEGDEVVVSLARWRDQLGSVASEAMKAETWLPILTLVLGWAGAQVTEVLKDRRASNRERQARQAELQRTTLLALQDVLLDLTNLVDKAAFTLSVSTREHPNEEAKTEAAREEWAARRRLWEATSKARLLVSRVEDDEARKQATLLLNIANGAGDFRLDEAAQAFEEVQAGYSQVVDRLGELIRKRY